MLLPKKASEILSFSALLFQETKDQKDSQDNPLRLNIFTESEVADMLEKVRLFEMAKAQGKKLANGGAGIATELEKLAYFREGFISHLEKLQEILAPSERARKSHEEVIRETQERTMRDLSDSYLKLNAKALRAVAEVILGDKHLDFTNEELPAKVAEMQVKGRI